jgi:hypothetical protein
MKWKIAINVLVVLAFVLGTMPSISHASMNHIMEPVVAAAESAAVSDQATHEDCHGHGEQKQDVQKTAAKKETSDKSSHCEGKCKCVSNSCSGYAKIFGMGNVGLAFPRTTKAPFSIEQQIVVSDLHSRIKRPPRA